jgi:glycosyltransferase involved in cell wall biosynthesis
MRDQLHHEFPQYASRIEFVPNGVLTGGAVARSAFRSPLKLITVGSLIRRKRVETLLEALADPACPTDTVLRVVGDGPERKSLEAMARSLALGSRVEFVGGVPPEQVAKHLSWAEVFVFESESEGRPNAVLEAMAGGMPILATDIPGVRELIGSDAGLLYAVGDSTGLARAIAHVNADPQSAHNLGREAKARIERSGLTWPAAGFRYAALYREIGKGTRKH